MSCNCPSKKPLNACCEPKPLDTPAKQLCYCCSKKPFNLCCQPYLDGKLIADSAEKLMRSRYSAYCTLNLDYLNKTALSNNLESITAHNWINLLIINTIDGTSSDDTGIVEFKATFEQNGALLTLHEVSQFKKVGDIWYYTHGEIK